MPSGMRTRSPTLAWVLVPASSRLEHALEDIDGARPGPAWTCGGTSGGRRVEGLEAEHAVALGL